MRIFGTDGIRGIANRVLSPELAYRAAVAASSVLGGESFKEVIIGRDTRHSGDLLEAALTAGFLSMGFNVRKTGVIPTPGIAYLTRTEQCALGVMISASHNPGEYNGIKFFNHKGLKLDDSIEDEIQRVMENGFESDEKPMGKLVGKVYDSSNLIDKYEAYLISKVGVDLNGVRVALDLGNGALYRLAPSILRKLGAEVFAINYEPDGMNINLNCGSTNPKLIQNLVLETGSDIGFSFDGDADRIIACDNSGKIIDGDHILAICAPYMKAKGELKGNAVIGTIMTNMGLDEYLGNLGIYTVKTKVGDRYILEEMLKNGYSVGGEQSGHIIFLDYNTTGDGMFTGMMLLKIMVETGMKSCDLNDTMNIYPQVLINAKVKDTNKYSYMEFEEIKSAIERLESDFNGKGRVVIRPSGTESLVRVMIEAKQAEGIEEKAIELAKLIESIIG